MKNNKLDFSLVSKRNQIFAAQICFAVMIMLALLSAIIGAATHYSKIWTTISGSMLIACIVITTALFFITLMTLIDSKAICKTIGFKQKFVTICTPIYWVLVVGFFVGIEAWKITYLEKHWMYWLIVFIYIVIWTGMSTIYGYMLKGLNKVIKK